MLSIKQEHFFFDFLLMKMQKKQKLNFFLIVTNLLTIIYEISLILK